MKKGNISLVHFPFTDLTDTKLRPAVVLVPENREGDVLLAFISTKIKKEYDTDVTITDLNKTGLKKKSIIKLNKITTLNKKIILGNIGELMPEQITEINTKLRTLLQL